MSSLQNHHGSVVEVNGIGILIEGPPGSGKTSLLFGILETCQNRNIRSSLVADDQVFLKSVSGRLVARAPDTTAGKAEVRGFGIVNLPYIDETVIQLTVQLADRSNVERMQEPGYREILGVSIPAIKVPKFHEAGAVRIVLAQLELLNDIAN